MASTHDLEEIAKLRDYGLAQGWLIPQIVEAILAKFDVSRLKAHRLARGWTRPQAVEEVLCTYDTDGLKRPRLNQQLLCAWEHNPKVRPGEDYLDRLCQVYQTRPDQLGYGHDYTPPTESAVIKPADAGDKPGAAYAGVPAASLVPVARGEEQDAAQEADPHDQEADTNRKQVLRAISATGLAALLDTAARASTRLSRKLETINAGPVTIEHLQLRVASFVQGWEHTLSEQLFREVFAQRQEVDALLDGRQSLNVQRELYRIAGQLSALLGHLSLNLGDYSAAYAHCLTAAQLAREVGDDALFAWVRMTQSTVALWAGDARLALSYAQDGQRYATGAERARLAARGEARAYARMRDQHGVIDALQRAERAMPGHPASDDPGGAWSFTPAALQLYTGISLLWLSQPEQAEPHTRRAIALYEAAPLTLQSPANQAQAQINLAMCLIRQDQPEEGLRLADGALGIDRGHVEANLQQAGEVLTALAPGHRDLEVAREFQERLRAIRVSRPTLQS